MCDFRVLKIEVFCFHIILVTSGNHNKICTMQNLKDIIVFIVSLLLLKIKREKSLFLKFIQLFMTI